MTANVSLTLLNQFKPKDFNLTDNISKEAFEEIVDDAINQIIEEIANTTGLIVNDIELEIMDD